MAQLPDKILQNLSEGSGLVDTLTLATNLKEEHQKVIGAVKSLQSVGGIIEAEQLTVTKTELTSEGKSFVEKGSHEALVHAAVPPGEQGILQAELTKVAGPAAKIGVSKAIQNGWIKIVKDGGSPKVIRVVDSIEDGVRNTLTEVANGKSSEVPAAALADLKKRKLLAQTPLTYYHVKRGPNFTLQIEKLETELTPEMLANGDWKKKKFKAYNFQALGAPLNAGHLHPLLKVRSEFRSILLEMGFSEMPTNRFVESSFWNFDALYVPQKHPARDAQDTFFMSQPEKCQSAPSDFMARVRAAHTGEEYDTLGYSPVWKKEESYKNCLRTHTTCISARMLQAIGSKPEFKPTKLFSIDRVYRNETLDATHLAEFHQVEGVVADYNLNLGNLIGVMKEFFSRLGITKLRFKPAYNPYTEPSMEVFSYHEGLKKWVEIGNSGMFRPEMLLPMGLPKDVRVIAWGLSLERPTMIRYGIDNIRDLVGPKVDLQMVYNNPICRLDTEFVIGSDGCYLDSPLLKSPIRVKGNSITSPVGDEPSAAKSSKNKKKRKKKKGTENEVKASEDEIAAVKVVEDAPPKSAGGDNPTTQRDLKKPQKKAKQQGKQPESAKVEAPKAKDCPQAANETESASAASPTQDSACNSSSAPAKKSRKRKSKAKAAATTP